MTMRLAAMAVLCLALGGCKLFETEVPAPDLNIVTVKPEPPKLPLECHTKGDPKWTPLPPKGVAVKTSDVIRRNDTNEVGFSSLKRKRAICDAAITKAGQ